MITTLWELSKSILKKIMYPGNRTFDKMTALITKALKKEKIFNLRKDTVLKGESDKTSFV
jgi:hypothetical protein